MSDEQLGELLRAELQAVTEDIRPSSELIERCLPPRRPWFPRRGALRMVALAVIAAVVILIGGMSVLSGSATSPAFALTVGHRSIHITLGQVMAVDGLNREFRRLGFPVRAVAMTASCESKVGMSYMGVEANGPANIQIGRDPSSPKDKTFILAAKRTSAKVVTFAMGTVTGPVPACVSSHGIGPGLPGWHLPAKDRLPTPSSTTSG